MASVSQPLVFYMKHEYRPPTPPEEERFREMWLARRPSAPMRLWQQAGLIAAEAGLMVLASRLGRRWKVVVLPPTAALSGWVSYTLISRLEERRAQELGLTVETTPEPSPSGCLMSLPWHLLWSFYVRLRGLEREPPPWTHILAGRLLSEWYRRRSWNRAMARIRAAAPDGATPPASRTPTGAPGGPGPR